MLGVELALVLDRADENAFVRELIGLVFLLALLADEQQRALAVAEAPVLERLLDEFRLARLQKAGEKVDGRLFGIIQGQNSSLRASSFIFEPITQKRPVTAGLPRRTSISPGT